MKSRLSKTTIFGCMVGVLLLLGGCGKFPGSSPPESGNNAWQTIREPLTSLRKNFERRRLMQFSRGVHPNYRRYQTGLRNNLADVYRVYSSIQLEFFGTRANRSDSSIVANVNWNLRWTCQSPINRAPSGCQNSSDVGNVIIRRGRTSFEFEYYEGEWRLINQTGDIIFGSLSPGTVQ